MLFAIENFGSYKKLKTSSMSGRGTLKLPKLLNLSFTVMPRSEGKSQYILKYSQSFVWPLPNAMPSVRNPALQLICKILKNC